MKSIVLSGGSGTRLWPLSRKAMPKQIYPLFGNASLLQKTIQRNQPLSDGLVVVTNEAQYEITNQQIATTLPLTYVLEPIGRNTAPAITLASLMLDPEEIVLVVSSDHLIQNESAYAEAVAQAKQFAQDGYLVVFGIQPTYAETGFGYIQAKGSEVLSFKEKPDLSTAEQYLAEGNYFWNAGMFCFKVASYLQALAQFQPELLQACRNAIYGKLTENPIRIPLDAMQMLKDISIDVAVIEQSKNVKIVPTDMGWSDLGSFDALSEVFTKDLHQNAANCNHFSINASNNFYFTQNKLVCAIDVHDLTVIDTSDALLLMPKGKSQEVKKLVGLLQDQHQAILEEVDSNIILENDKIKIYTKVLQSQTTWLVPKNVAISSNAPLNVNGMLINDLINYNLDQNAVVLNASNAAIKLIVTDWK